MLSHDKRTGHAPETPVVQDQTPVDVQAFNVPTTITHVVDTRVIPAPVGNAHMLTLGAQTTAELLLPNDPKRRSAVVLAVDNDVFIATSLEEAQAVSGTTNGSSGFYLPKGIPVSIPTSSPFWAAPTTVASLSRVSVMTFKD